MQEMKWGGGCKKVDLSSTQGALCTVSVFFILHFTYLGVRTHPTHPPAYGPGRHRAAGGRHAGWFEREVVSHVTGSDQSAMSQSYKQASSSRHAGRKLTRRRGDAIARAESVIRAQWTIAESQLHTFSAKTETPRAGFSREFD